MLAYEIGLSGAFKSHVARTFQATGMGGVPTGATAVTGNLTVTQQSSLGDPVNAFLDYGDVDVVSAASGLLSGLSFAVKDIFDVAGYFTPASSQ